MREIAASGTSTRILEVGCGTGKNLMQLGRAFPQARLWGLDLSGDMLAVARKKLQDLAPRLTLIQAAYDRPVGEAHPFDLVVFSYALSMFNPGWEEALEAAHNDLAKGGAIAVVDFYDSLADVQALDGVEPCPPGRPPAPRFAKPLPQPPFHHSARFRRHLVLFSLCRPESLIFLGGGPGT